MTTPARPIQPDLPESMVSELHALYREGTAAEPDLSLDRRILDAARDELRADHALKSARPIPWWKTWTRAMTTVAVMILGLSVTWNLMDEQERVLRDELSGAGSPREIAERTTSGETRTERATNSALPTKDQAALAARGIGAQPEVGSVTQSTLPKRQDEKTANTGVISSLPQSPDAAGAPEEVRRRQAIAAPPAPALVTPEAVMGKLKSVGGIAAHPSSSGADELHEKKLDTGVAAESTSGPETRLRKAETMRRNADIALDAAPASAADAIVTHAAKPAASPAMAKEGDSAIDAVTPQAWIEQIRKLRASGRVAEAVQSLERLQKRYPGLTLPDDLGDLKSR